MAKCNTCRKVQMDTAWEKFRHFFFRRFTTDIKDLKADSYTQGIGDGYKLGFESAKQHLRETAKRVHNIDI